MQVMVCDSLRVTEVPPVCFKESPPLIGQCLAVLTGIFVSCESFGSL